MKLNELLLTQGVGTTKVLNKKKTKVNRPNINMMNKKQLIVYKESLLEVIEDYKLLLDEVNDRIKLK